MAKVKLDINNYARSQPPKVRQWLAEIDKLMLDGNCRIASSLVSNSKRTDAKFSYTSKRTRKAICIINMGTSGNYISMRGNHFVHPIGDNVILDELPEEMLDFVMKGAGCGSGHCLNRDYTVNADNTCVHKHAEVFEFKGQKSFKCSHYGWNVDLNEATDFEILTKWIVLETAWRLSKPV
ncbi:MAG: hypothetical protein FWF77_01455 [Defluviitaleaceae bacterium]|nr:hypothetical protein [Defluviitaleaceae bacterium]